VIARADEQALAPLLNPHVREMIRKLRIHSVLLTPITAACEIIGAISLTRHPPSEPFDEQDRALLDDLGERAGLAIVNARLYQAEVETRERLDRAERHASFLAEASKQLGATLETDALWSLIARLV